MGDALPNLKGRVVRLHPATPGELHSLASALARDTHASEWLGDDAGTIERWLFGDGVAAFVVSAADEPLGVITFEEECDPDYRSANIDVGLLSHATGRGLGTDAVRTVAEWLYSERGHHRITIDPAVENSRAIRAYEKVGFRPVGVMRQYERGRDGVWHDSLLMDMLAGQMQDPRT